MATWVTYCCNQCYYSLEISGGRDAVFMGYTDTMVCQDCQELSDYITETPEGKKIKELTCDECGKHNITNWNYKTKPCPQCEEGKMKKMEGGTIIHAD